MLRLVWSCDSGETWVGAVSSACSAVASKNKIAIKCLCNSARCLQSQYLQRTLKCFADRCFMQLCISVIMKSIFFQYRCLQWISSWEWMLYLTAPITSLQTYHYEQVGTLTIWWSHCPADSSCLFSFEEFFSEPFLFTNLCVIIVDCKSCELVFLLHLFASFFPSRNFQQWGKLDFLVACTETESFSSFPGETRTVTKELWVTQFYKFLCWGFFLNLNLQRVACCYCQFADCTMCFFSFWMLLH